VCFSFEVHVFVEYDFLVGCLSDWSAEALHVASADPDAGWLDLLPVWRSRRRDMVHQVTVRDHCARPVGRLLISAAQVSAGGSPPGAQRKSLRGGV
jgi:hypothetical protein